MNEILRASPLPALDYVLAGAAAVILGVVLATFAVAQCAHARMLASR